MTLTVLRRTSFFVVALLLGTAAARAQSVGIGTTTPDASAALDVRSSSQGFLPPRLTYAQRTGISNAAAGLLVYQSNANASPVAPAGYYYYTGTQWLPLSQGDNLGTHTATQNLDLGASRLVGNGGTAGLVIGSTGNVGIGVASPAFRLEVNGSVGVNGSLSLANASVLQTGSGVSGRQADAGKIGYGNLSGGTTLDIAGAGPTAATRRVKLWAEGGTELAGPLKVNALTTAGVVTTDASGNLGSTPASTLADNLGNHTATQALDLQANVLTGTGANLGTAVGLGVRADGGLNLGQNTAGNNVFVGYQAGQANVIGGSNQFIGYQSGANNLAGTQNQFSGYQSGYANTLGRYNQFSGYQSGFGNTGGEFNQFSGYRSGFSNTTGSRNQFSGFQSGFGNTQGEFNQFSGYQSGAGNTVGNSNQFSGYQSGAGNTTGSSNQFAGFQSGSDNIYGSRNLFIGYQSGQGSAASNENCFVGYQSGINNAGGSGNLALGYQAGPTTSLTNAGAIGYQAQVSQSNSLVLGGTGSFAVKVGIGTDAPTATLDVVGTARLRGLTAAGLVTTDASGNLGSTPVPADAQTLSVTATSLSISGGNSVPLASLADNLGNHTATQTLNLNGNQLSGGTSANIGISAAQTLEFGAGTAGKETNAGKIGYNAFGSGALDIVGAGTTGSNRKIKLWAEGGTTVNTLAGTGTRVVLADASGALSTTSAAATALDALLRMQRGTAVLGTSASGLKVFTVTFPVAFAAAPGQVLCTVRGQSGAPVFDTFGTTTYSVSATGFTVNVIRLDAPSSGWGQALQLDWLALP